MESVGKGLTCTAPACAAPGGTRKACRPSLSVHPGRWALDDGKGVGVESERRREDEVIGLAAGVWIGTMINWSPEDEAGCTTRTGAPQSAWQALARRVEKALRRTFFLSRSPSDGRACTDSRFCHSGFRPRRQKFKGPSSQGQPKGHLPRRPDVVGSQARRLSREKASVLGRVERCDALLAGRTCLVSLMRHATSSLPVPP